MTRSTLFLIALLVAILGAFLLLEATASSPAVDPFATAGPRDSRPESSGISERGGRKGLESRAFTSDGATEGEVGLKERHRADPHLLRVIDETGEGLPDIRVSWLGDGDPPGLDGILEPWRRAPHAPTRLTDATGRVRIGEARRGGRVFLRAVRALRASRVVALPAHRGEEREIVLPPATGCRVRVVDPSGRPVPQVPVALVREITTARGHVGRKTADQALTDEEGEAILVIETASSEGDRFFATVDLPLATVPRQAVRPERGPSSPAVLVLPAMGRLAVSFPAGAQEALADHTVVLLTTPAIDEMAPSYHLSRRIPRHGPLIIPQVPLGTVLELSLDAAHSMIDLPDEGAVLRVPGPTSPGETVHAHLEFARPRGRPIALRIHRADGTTLAEHRVTLQVAHPEIPGRLLAFGRARRRTDAQGRLAFHLDPEAMEPRMDDGRCRIRVEVAAGNPDAPARLWGAVGFVDLPPAPWPEALELEPLVLAAPELRLTGRVRRADGRPAIEARVRLEETAAGGHTRWRGRTDAEGRFAIPDIGLPPPDPTRESSHRLVVHAREHAPWRRELSTRDLAEPQDIHLEPGRDVRVLFHLDAGIGAFGLALRVGAVGGGGPPRVFRPEVPGLPCFHLIGLPESGLGLELVTDDDGEALSLAGFALPADGRDVVHDLRGAVPRTEIEIVSADGRPLRGRVLFGPSRELPLPRDGRLAFPTAGATHGLEIRAQAHAECRFSGPPRESVVRLRAAREITIEVRDEAGRPFGAHLDQRLLLEGRRGAHLHPLQNGRVRVLEDQVSSGRWKLYLREPGGGGEVRTAQVALAPDAEELTVRFEAP